jgi:FkbM family methyltransferase
VSALRAFAWRLGRKLYRWGRRDVANDPASNGEYWLLDHAVASDPHGTFVDIGANVGDWSARALERVRGARGRGSILAFEPTASTFAHLSRRFASDGAQVALKRVALSDRAGEAEFHVVGDLAGTNSLNAAPGSRVEIVSTQRLDDALAAAGIERVTLVKSDTEGHDMPVLLGAERLLAGGRIDAWQFEYNHRWLAGRWSLGSVFDFISGKPYVLGKLVGEGIETYAQWHQELERYFEGNYVLVRKDGAFQRLCRPMRFDASNVARETRA